MYRAEDDISTYPKIYEFYAFYPIFCHHQHSDSCTNQKIVNVIGLQLATGKIWV